MVKKMISRLLVSAMLIVFIAACSQKSEYTSAIPADASAVASINLKSLADKSGLKDKENEAAKQKMIEALKSGTTAATFQQLEKVLNNPKESGIDVDAPVYVFTSPSFPYASLVTKILDIDKLRTSLDVMVKEQICQPVEETDGYSYAVVANQNIFAFNETTAMLVQVNRKSQMENAQKAIGELMKQTPEKSIAGNAGFQKMQKQKGDVNFLASLAALPQAYARQLNIGLTSIKVDPKDIMALGNLKNGNALKALYDNKKALNLKRGEDIVLLSDNEYVYKSRAMNIFFGFKDNQMYATNDELLYKNIGKAADKSIKDTSYASDMKGTSSLSSIWTPFSNCR